ncbi:MAG: class I SAM-dependent methyltransferase [Spirochaetaceae bacterium]|jgi:ubiquinone/menaquinone biosynthesis C-methylase UbiE|nr:class I SAM-dependent methyltransferase [Spirochaetaceae bacterium]
METADIFKTPQVTGGGGGYFDVFKAHTGFVSNKWIHYFFIYDRIFSRFLSAGKPVTLLEIGVQNGGSLEIWKKYLPENSQIHGIDIDEKCLKLQFDSNIYFHLGSAADSDFMNQTFKDIQFDIILDDGSHICKDVIKTFIDMFPKLKWGGMYVVEDMHTSYWKEYGGDLKKRGSSIEYFKNFIDVLNFDYIRIKKHNFLKRSFRKRFYEFKTMICEVSFFDSICKIDKLYQPKNDSFKNSLSGLTDTVEPLLKIINSADKESVLIEKTRRMFNS